MQFSRAFIPPCTRFKRGFSLGPGRVVPRGTLENTLLHLLLQQLSNLMPILKKFRFFFQLQFPFVG